MGARGVEPKFLAIAAEDGPVNAEALGVVWGIVDDALALGEEVNPLFRVGRGLEALRRVWSSAPFRLSAALAPLGNIVRSWLEVYSQPRRRAVDGSLMPMRPAALAASMRVAMMSPCRR